MSKLQRVRDGPKKGWHLSGRLMLVESDIRLRNVVIMFVALYIAFASLSCPAVVTTAHFLVTSLFVFTHLYMITDCFILDT